MAYLEYSLSSDKRLDIDLFVIVSIMLLARGAERLRGQNAQPFEPDLSHISVGRTYGLACCG